MSYHVLLSMVRLALTVASTLLIKEMLRITRAPLALFGRPAFDQSGQPTLACISAVNRATLDFER